MRKNPNITRSTWSSWNSTKVQQLKDTRNTALSPQATLRHGPVVVDFVVSNKMSGWQSSWVGTVNNPKTMRPYFVYAAVKSRDYFGGSVFVPSSSNEQVLMGAGYLDEDDSAYNDYISIARKTKLPRVHTVQGVAFGGEGLGTSLYVGMAAVAAFFDEAGADRPPYSGAGVCSGYGASDEAKTWWEKAAAAKLARKVKDGYTLRFKTPVKQGLVLDLTPRMKTEVPAMPNVVTMLNLDEIEDPKALVYFYQLAFGHGANLDEVSAMRSRAEGARPDKSAAVLAELRKAAREDRGSAARGLQLETHGIRTNPSDGLAALAEQPVVRTNPRGIDYEDVAATIYPDYVGLDD